MERLFPAMVCILAILASTTASTSFAQIPPPANPATLWSFLGIPQGARKVSGALVNRRGNFPGLEKKIPLKALNDPMNLESPIKSIKKAAEIKTAEDMKKQKIKAIKYLAKIGCGCYDTSGEITAALLESSEDCTEEVRLATMEAVKAAADGGCCSNCSQKCCCNEDMVKQLAKIAYERKDDGCYFEASERVRDAAKEALKTCCPNELSDLEIEILPEELNKGPEGTPPEELLPSEGDGTKSEEVRPSTTPRENQHSAQVGTGNTHRQAGARRPQGGLLTELLGTSDPHKPAGFPAPVRSKRLSNIAENATVGTVVAMDKNRGLAHLHLAKNSLLQPGTQLSVYQLQGGEHAWLGDVEVYETVADTANVRMIGMANVSEFRLGDKAVLATPDGTVPGQAGRSAAAEPQQDHVGHRTAARPVNFSPVTTQ